MQWNNVRPTPVSAICFIVSVLGDEPQNESDTRCWRYVKAWYRISAFVTIARQWRSSVMRKVIALEFVTLDGVIQAGGGPEEDTSGGFAYGGWQTPYSDDVIEAVMKKQMNMPFDLLLGRKTFDIWAPYWPQHADQWPGVMTATKYVASNTMTSSEWQPSVFLGGDIAEHVRTLKQQQGPDLHVYGSANLLQTLMKHDLVDAFWLKIYPITLGSGKRLFTDGAIPAAFTVTESHVSPSGVILVNYERAGAITTGSFGS
jgi:dihydrofolate reductase